MNKLAMERIKYPELSVHNGACLPPLPATPDTHTEPSVLYQIVLKNSEHPPIMKGTSWTQAAPFKEERYHRSPSESIANNYTPSASDLKLRDLPKLKGYKQREARMLKRELTQMSPRPAKVAGAAKRAKTQVSINNQLSGMNGHGVELVEPVLPPSRPLSPVEQLTIIRGIESETVRITGDPTESDMQRYYYYIDSGVKPEMVCSPAREQVQKIHSLIPTELVRTPSFQPLITNLHQELDADYQYSMRKGIVDYVLKDPEEKLRLNITCTPKPFPQRVIRAPVPWHEDYKQAKEYNTGHLFMTNSMMLELQRVWHERFSVCRFVNKKELLDAELPLLPSEFESLVKKQCWDAHENLRKNWVPICAKMFVDKREFWHHLVPQNDVDSVERVEEFFSCVASLMSNQLRQMVMNSLADLLDFFAIHKAGNDFAEEFDDLQYVMKQVMLVRLRVEEPKIVFDPPFRECRDIILRCFSEIIASAEGLPRVEMELFPEMRGQKLLLRAVKLEEDLVTDFMDRVMEMFRANTEGPQKYLNTYKKYTNLLNNKAEQDVTGFLKESHSLMGYQQKIVSFQDVRDEIGSLRVTVPLSMFCLDCKQLNEDLCARAQKLRNRIIQFEVDDNRELNRSICRRFDEMSDRISEMPEDTDALVALQEYLKECQEITVHKLKDEIDEAANRLMFLLDYANFQFEDIKLNSTVFHWPEHIKTVFELSQNRMMSRREHAEDELKKKKVPTATLR